MVVWSNGLWEIRCTVSANLQVTRTVPDCHSIWNGIVNSFTTWLLFPKVSKPCIRLSTKTYNTQEKCHENLMERVVRFEKLIIPSMVVFGFEEKCQRFWYFTLGNCFKFEVSLLEFILLFYILSIEVTVCVEIMVIYLHHFYPKNSWNQLIYY